MTTCTTCGDPITRVDGHWEHWNGGRSKVGDHPPVPEPLPAHVAALTAAVRIVG